MKKAEKKCDHTDVISFTFSEQAGGETIRRCADKDCTYFDADRNRILRSEGGRKQ